jgi:hypothetical protein
MGYRMLRQKVQLAIGVTAILSAGFGFLGSTASASAFVFDQTSVKDITSQDVGESFIVKFDGNVDRTDVEGLSSWAKFTLQSFTGSSAIFDIELENTSTGSITSRTSALGFDIDEGSLDSASVAPGGLFEKAHINGSFPNGFGSIETCFTDGNNCQGGQNGGVSSKEGASTFTSTVQLTQSVEKFAMSNFGVRYQSIQGTALGTSGTGRGTPFYEQPPPQSIPEPGTLTALLVSGLALVQQRRRKQMTKSEA